MQLETVNTRLKLTMSLYRELKHIAVDKGVPVSDLLLAAAEQLVKATKIDESVKTTEG